MKKLTLTQILEGIDITVVNRKVMQRYSRADLSNKTPTECLHIKTTLSREAFNEELLDQLYNLWLKS